MSVRKFLRVEVCILALSLLCSATNARATTSFWQESEEKAMQAQATDPPAAIAMYRAAIKDAETEKAPIEKQLGLVLNCGNLAFRNWYLPDANELYSQGASLAHANNLRNWEARFLVMTSRNLHYMFNENLAAANSNDPSLGLKALELRPPKEHTATEFHVTCLQAIGDAYLDKKDYENADKYLRQALAECQQLPDEDWKVEAIVRSYLAMRMEQHRYADATKLLVLTAMSDPRTAAETKKYYFREIDGVDSTTASIVSKVHTLWHQHNFAGLDAYAEKLRSDQTQLVDGRAPIDVFIEELEPPDWYPEHRWQEQIDQFNDWIQQRPTSATARIALANTLRGYAWKARAGGWAKTVTNEGWRLMARRLAEAWKVLYVVDHRTPDWYSVAQRIALGQQWTHAQYDTLVAIARKAYPTYNTVIFDKSYWLQPKWYGKPGEALQYINAEANKRPGIAGDVLYAQIAWNLDFSFQNVIKDARLDWARVKRGLLELTKRYPNALGLKGEFGFLAAQMGDKATASFVYAGASTADVPIKLHPVGYLDNLAKGDDLKQEDKRNEAIAAYSKAIALDPTGAQAYLSRCEMYLMTNRHKEALADVNKCLSMYPEWAKALGERGRLENVMEKYASSIADLEKSLTVDPAEFNSLSTLGHDYDEMGEHQRALDVANYALELSKLQEPGGVYYSYQDRGLVWSNAHQEDQAREDLDAGLQLRPTWSQMWAYLAYVYAATDQMDKALKAADALFATESFKPRGYRLRAEMYRAAGQWDMAIQDYDKSTNLEPTYGPGFWQRAVAEMAVGNYKEAQANLRTSVSLIPTSALAHSYLALAEELVGKPDVAQIEIAEAFKITPDLPINYVNRARIELHRDEVQKAAEDCDRALHLDPYSSDAYETAAVIFERAGKTAAAKQFYERATQMWWHPWKVPLPIQGETHAAEVSITLPQLSELKPKGFVMSLPDAAP